MSVAGVATSAAAVAGEVRVQTQGALLTGLALLAGIALGGALAWAVLRARSVEPRRWLLARTAGVWVVLPVLLLAYELFRAAVQRGLILPPGGESALSLLPGILLAAMTVLAGSSALQAALRETAAALAPVQHGVWFAGSLLAALLLLNVAPSRVTPVLPVVAGLCFAIAILRQPRLAPPQLAPRATDAAGCTLAAGVLALLSGLLMLPQIPAQPAGRPDASAPQRYAAALFETGGLRVATVRSDAQLWSVDLDYHDLDVLWLASEQLGGHTAIPRGSARLVQRMESALRPGGRIVITLPAPGILQEIIDWFADGRILSAARVYHLRVESDGQVLEAAVVGRDVQAWLASRAHPPQVRVQVQPLERGALER